jgi:hypothetical protein
VPCRHGARGPRRAHTADRMTWDHPSRCQNMFTAAGCLYTVSVFGGTGSGPRARCRRPQVGPTRRLTDGCRVPDHRRPDMPTPTRSPDSNQCLIDLATVIGRLQAVLIDLDGTMSPVDQVVRCRAILIAEGLTYLGDDAPCGICGRQPTITCAVESTDPDHPDTATLCGVHVAL